METTEGDGEPKNDRLARLICLVNGFSYDGFLVLEECPFCHKFLAAELMSKTEIDTAEALKEKDVLFKLGLAIDTGERVADHPEAFITYKFTYRCRDCGKEWDKFKIQAVELPKEYVEDEDDKSDYDADKEAEDAREEQYAMEE